METYLEFASVYDEFMEDVPYDKWYKFIKESMVKYKVNPEIICDLGCGTGKICEYFAKDKIESIGIDNSFEMLNIAKEEALKQELNILYLNQDITEFELYGTVNVICSTCDSLNYITLEEELLQIFKLVNNYLDPGGLFIFDLNTIYKYKTILAEETFANQTDQAAYIWQNFYDEEEEINEFWMPLYSLPYLAEFFPH
ncbi:hypothetical protein AN643_03170 [Candidatus Epulonipiscioides saccharophilum]|nr:hypothetical protein AN643_03170 [Epulopiscium sp. SCG-B10WGA-EpuloB]